MSWRGRSRPPPGGGARRRLTDDRENSLRSRGADPRRLPRHWGPHRPAALRRARTPPPPPARRRPAGAARHIPRTWCGARTLEPLSKLSYAGRAIFVSSAAAQHARAYTGVYSSSKAALEALAKSWAAELVNTNVRVNVVQPGPTRTGLRAQYMPGEDPMTLPAPEDMTDIYVDLASPACTRTGEILTAYRRKP